jgi:Domain of unknown function (DUF4440)
MVSQDRSEDVTRYSMNGRKQLHAENFELVNPGGATFSKDRYLGAMTSGELDYVVCEVDSPMRVRVRADAAVIRSSSSISERHLV